LSSKIREKQKAEPVTPIPMGSEGILFVDDEKALVDIGKQPLLS
jgi:hypothetical protein